jgi:hypothetical protein
MGRFERYLDDPPAGLHPEPVVLLFGGCSAIVVRNTPPSLRAFAQSLRGTLPGLNTS